MERFDARFIPSEVAVCPICGKRIWIDSIDEMSQEEEGDPWLPEQVSLNCEDEPEIGSAEWQEWHNWHFAMPYVDWLPVSEDVLRWLRQPEQRERVELIPDDEGDDR